MKTTLSYVSYFQSLAAKANFIDQFYYKFNEFKENADQTEGTIMVLEPYENPISENQNDNALSERSGFFAIIKPYESRLGREIAEVEDACERICYKILGQMKRDSRAGLITMDIQNFQGEAVEPTVGNFVGYALSFTFEESINTLMARDDDDWTE